MIIPYQNVTYLFLVYRIANFFQKTSKPLTEFLISLKYYSLHFKPVSLRKRSASRVAAHPVPAAVMA